MKKFNKLSVATFAILFALIVVVIVGKIATRATATAPTLGTASGFAVLAGAGITDVPTSAIIGNAGSDPTTSNGLPNGEVTGTNYKENDAAVEAAKDALSTAYTYASTQAALPDIDTALGSQNLSPGVYHAASGTFDLTGTLTLNGGGNPNAVFIFQTNTTLVTHDASKVVLTNGAQACNVFWAVGSAATLLNTTFVGTIMANSEAITDSGGSTINGRLLAKTAAVTLNHTTVTVPTCATPNLTLIKTITKDNGGIADVGDWTLTAKGPDTISGATGSVAVTDAIVTAGEYTLSESLLPTGYTGSTYSCVKNGGIAVISNTINLIGSDDATCTINNDDIAPVLHIIKHVINDDGGIHPNAADFTINITGTNVSDASFPGEENPGTTITLDAGAYTINESVVAGYTKTLGANCSGTIAVGGVKNCTITNNDNPPGVLPGTIAVVKHVVGGTKVPADFNLFVNGNQVDSGAVNDFVPGAYVITEDTDSSYDQTFSPDCGVNGHLNLAANEDRICIITNTYIAPSGPPAYVVQSVVPPIIDVVKLPSPLSLPDGPGLVNYTYTLRNIGTVPVTNLTMVGDTCGPITLTSGDANSDSKLDLNEIWVYNCSTTLSVTHTNIVTATGWANGISATDIASATVVVGLPIVPPLIHITKVPSPLTLPANGGMVTYTKKITNPGTVALSNVHITDDKCSPIHYVSGDINKDYKLDTTETWTYTCQSNLTKTTTNTATATGEANGLTARDLAIVTVVVAAPGLPSTGLPSAPWNIVIIVETLVLILILLFVILKKRKD